jgi:hypothetical protein
MIENTKVAFSFSYTKENDETISVSQLSDKVFVIDTMASHRKHLTNHVRMMNELLELNMRMNLTPLRGRY